jgi:tetratricopeptide (TPR) repeat protein
MRELGIAHFQAQEVDKALDVLQAALPAFPHDTSLLYYLAQGYQEKDRWDQALSFYQRVLEIDPRRVEIYYNLGVIYDKKGLLGPAHEHFGLYFKKRGQRETALFHFQKAWEHTRDWEKRRKLEKLIETLER